MSVFIRSDRQTTLMSVSIRFDRQHTSFFCRSDRQTAHQSSSGLTYKQYVSTHQVYQTTHQCLSGLTDDTSVFIGSYSQTTRQCSSDLIDRQHRGCWSDRQRVSLHRDSGSDNTPMFIASDRQTKGGTHNTSLRYRRGFASGRQNRNKNNNNSKKKKKRKPGPHFCPQRSLAERCRVR